MAQEADIGRIVVSEDELHDRIVELGKDITSDYAGRPPLLVGVLKGAFVFMSDLSRAIDLPVEFDFMAVSSYGSATRSSGVVRIIKDLDLDLTGRDVLIVEDIVDSGLTLAYLRKNLAARARHHSRSARCWSRTACSAWSSTSDTSGFASRPCSCSGTGSTWESATAIFPTSRSTPEPASSDVAHAGHAVRESAPG